MLTTALLTLTLTAGSDLRMTLSTVADATACEAARESVTSVLTDAGIEIVAARCGVTDLRLTPFEHGAGPEAEIHRYRVDLSDPQGFAVTPLGVDGRCIADAPPVYCARSSQSVITD
ncbi:hypothetical protein I5535_17065 [Rhodobacteraceae bacterium F11138]|nr:hypothetical protein [Rhodobacteraceae bacterium F11138]